MRVFMSHRYFWPDRAPDAAILRWVARHLVVHGCSVDVVSAQPSYHGSFDLDRRPTKEMLDGIHVTRLRLPPESGSKVWRVVNALYLCLYTLLKTVFGDYDVIIVSTVPPIVGAFCSAISARLTNAKLVYYCMDLHPEVGRLSGDFKNPTLYRLLSWMDDWSCRQATTVLVHSEDMKYTLRQRKRGIEYKIDILNSFSPPTEVDVQTAPGDDDGVRRARLNLIYAGNVGRFQGLETLIDAMGMLVQRSDIELVIIGEGVVKSNLVERVKSLKANVRFIGYQPPAIAKNFIRRADLGLVMLSPDVYRYAYPSKTMAYLEQGIPILAIVECESELAKAILTDGCGFTIPNGSATDLSRLLLKISEDCSWKDSMRLAAFSAFNNRFSTDAALDKWLKIVRFRHI
jgi:glycosyltransferase involved in cell wall biosynthesis